MRIYETWALFMQSKNQQSLPDPFRQKKHLQQTGRWPYGTDHEKKKKIFGYKLPVPYFYNSFKEL